MQINLEKIKKVYDCLKQSFQKNIYKEPKCYVCQNTKVTCSLVLATTILALVIIF